MSAAFRLPKIQLLLLAAATLAAGCSLSAPASRQITVSFPTGASHAARALDQNSQPANPTSISDFNCLAINVIGPGIPANPGLSCGQAPVGILGGFVSTSSGSITVDVPAGPGRTVQLIGVVTSVGCPDLGTLLASKDSSAFNGIGNPYLIGTTTTDVTTDTSVSIRASFDSTNPTLAFDGCGSTAAGEGPSYAPTAATKDSLPSPMNPARLDFAFQGTATTPTVSATAVTAAELAQLAADLPGTDNVPYPQTQPATRPALGVYNAVSGNTTTGRRAAMQLLWDASSWDLGTYPYGQLRLRVMGGTESDSANCPAVFGAQMGPTVNTAVWYAKGGYWMPLQQSSAGVWYWNFGGFDVAPVPVADLLTTRPDGKKYLVVNVESNFLSDGTCESAVHVSGASFSARAAQTRDSQDNGGSFAMNIGGEGAVLVGFGVGGSVFTTGSGYAFGLSVNGGTPPYAFSNSHPTTGSVDPATGHYIAANGTGADVVTVVDSAGASATTTVTVVDPTAVTGVVITSLLNATLGTASTIFTAGDCAAVTVSTQGFSYHSPAAPAAISYLVNGPFNGMGQYFTNATCTNTPMSQPPQIPGGSSLLTFSFRVTTAGTPSIMVGLTNGSMTGPMLTVAPGAWTAVGFGPNNPVSAASQSACLPFTVYAEDSYGNVVSTPGTAVPVSGFSDSSAGGSFWGGTGCTSPPLSSLTVNGGSPQTIYYRTGSSYTGGVSFGISSPGGLTYVSSSSFQVVGSTAPTTLLAYFPATPGQGQPTVDTAPSTGSEPAGSACAEVDVLPVDSFGKFQLTSGTGTLTVSLNNLPGPLYSDSACATNPGTNQIGIPEGGMGVFYMRMPATVPASRTLQAMQTGCTGTCFPSLNQGVLGY